MIESITIFKGNNTVIIRYKSGNIKTYMKLSEKATGFILREDVKAFENEISVMYKEVKQMG